MLNRDIEMSMAPNEDFPPLPAVVVVIPCLNEENHIENTLAVFMAEGTRESSFGRRQHRPTLQIVAMR